MVAILFAAASVAAGGLDVAIGIGTNPYLRPCRRHRDRIDTREFIAIDDDRARRIAIDKPFAIALPYDSSPSIIDVSQSCRLGGDDCRVMRQTELVRRARAEGIFHVTLLRPLRHQNTQDGAAVTDQAAQPLVCISFKWHQWRPQKT